MCVKPFNEEKFIEMTISTEKHLLRAGYQYFYNFSNLM
jgi:hypothetical protein